MSGNFLKASEKSITNILIVMLMLIAWLMIGQKIDQHLRSLGLSAAQCGTNLMGAALAGYGALRTAAGVAKSGAQMATGQSFNSLAHDKLEQAGALNTNKKEADISKRENGNKADNARNDQIGNMGKKPINPEGMDKRYTASKGKMSNTAFKDGSSATLAPMNELRKHGIKGTPVGKDKDGTEMGVALTGKRGSSAEKWATSQFGDPGFDYSKAGIGNISGTTSDGAIAYGADGNAYVSSSALDESGRNYAKSEGLEIANKEAVDKGIADPIYKYDPSNIKGTAHDSYLKGHTDNGFANSGLSRRDTRQAMGLNNETSGDSTIKDKVKKIIDKMS